MTNLKAVVSKRTVDALEAPKTGESRLWDSRTTGFFVRCYPSGRKVYAVRYRLGKATKVYTIGKHGAPWTPDSARDKASQILAEAALGGDPANAKAILKNALTISDLITLYLEEGPSTKPRKRASTWSADASRLKRHVIPLVGKKIANTLTRPQAAKMVQAIADGKTAVVEKTDKKRGLARVTGGEVAAQRTLATVKAMFNWGIQNSYISENPFTNITRGNEKSSERFLSQSEALKVLTALDELEREGNVQSAHADALRLLMLTGARKSEILALTWDEVRHNQRRLVLPPLRTKAGSTTGERHIILMPEALEILTRRLNNRPTRLSKDGAEIYADFVFPSDRTDGHIDGLRRVMNRVLAKADVPHARIHDLRHTFASFAIANKADLLLVSKLLGHANTRVTERYAHLTSDPLEEAVGRIGGLMFERI